jgi:ATP-dependent RNA helicase DDX10/DBP4
MAKGHTRSRPPPHVPGPRPKVLKRKREVEDLEALDLQVRELDPHNATPPEKFTDLPLSQATQSGLKASHFSTLTQIQSRAIPTALKGGDILGAAKTGSGKTLAFLVPVLENLYKKRWTEYDGLGALILSPTRELAIQIFEVLKQIGRNHSFSAGLVIGGKHLQEERERLGRMNILVATPGRIQQHLDQTAELDVGNLQMLVLDEADRILDMGFAHTLDAIIEHLPKERQTMLFSATQTRKVSDLARLSLTEPAFVSVHDTAESATPAKLQQNYVVSPLPEKLDTLWSFLKANVKKKILVFISSGKQVRFFYEAFRHLQPGLTLLHLHGRQKQAARLDITKRFSNSRYACLFSTDVAARGLDFPSVDWVVQLDCPEDPDTYIHRVGRTARFEHEGRAVMFLDPSEEAGMIGALERSKVHLEKINVRQNKMQNTIKNQLQNMCFKDPELKYLGQKAFVSYVRSIIVQKDKDIFDIKKLDLEAYAASLGLPGAPRVKFVKGEDANKRKNMPRQLLRLQDGGESGSDAEAEGAEVVQKQKKEIRTKYDRMFERQNQDVLADHYTKLIQEDDPTEQRDAGLASPEAEEDDGGFLSVKRRFTAGDTALEQDSASSTDEEGASTKPKVVQLGTKPDEVLIVDSKRREKLLSSKKKLLKYKGHGEHLHFSDDETKPEPYKKEYYEDEDAFKAAGDAEAQRRAFLDEETQKVKERDAVDKEVARAKKREKRNKRKERERAELADEDGSDDEDGDAGVQLAHAGEEVALDWSDRDEADEADEAGSVGKKRQKKWFEDPSSNDDASVGKRKKSKNRSKHDDVQEPQTLEDLEAMAAGLLAG